MKRDLVLTPQQRVLVEDNLSVVDKTIARYISVNENVCGLGRDDLRQEGAVALCRAAATYDGTSAKFSTYAAVVVRNHLFNHCKLVNASQRNLPFISLDMESQDDGRRPPFPEPSVPDTSDALIEALDTANFLEGCKQRYSGVARLGVEALELKVKGLSGADIARLYGVKPNQVGAWISRATQKIRKDAALGVEKQLR